MQSLIMQSDINSECAPLPQQTARRIFGGAVVLDAIYVSALCADGYFIQSSSATVYLLCPFLWTMYIKLSSNSETWVRGINIYVFTWNYQPCKEYQIENCPADFFSQSHFFDCTTVLLQIFEHYEAFITTVFLRFWISSFPSLWISTFTG